MAIKYFKLKRKFFINGELKEKYLPKIQIETKVGFEEIAEMIEKKSTVSRGDIMGVLSELETTACWMLENGHPVTLGLMGTFYPYVEAKTVDSPEEVSGKLITRFKAIFKPSAYLKKRFKVVKFVLGDNIVREVKHKKNI